MSCYSLLKGPACGEEEPEELFWVRVVFKQVATCVKGEPNTCKSPPSTSLIPTAGSQMPRSPDLSHVWLQITFFFLLAGGAGMCFGGFARIGAMSYCTDGGAMTAALQTLLGKDHRKALFVLKVQQVPSTPPDPSRLQISSKGLLSAAPPRQ